MNLSPEQKRIVEHMDGALLVKAGPGSGRARAFTERIKRLATEKGRRKVLVMTISDMAAREIRSRLETDPEAEEAIKRVNIGTIHSFCREVIQSRGNLIGLRPDVSLFENESDRIDVLRRVISDEADLKMFSRRRRKPEALLASHLSAISELKRSLTPPERSDQDEPFPAIYENYNAVLHNRNALDFDDIPFFAYRILAENPDVAELYNSVYRYVCIVESQDLNDAQYNVIHALCGSNFRVF